MINKIISFSLNQRIVTLAAAVVMSGLGIWSVLNLSTDSFPDVSNVQVQIITEPQSMATEEVETLITYPIENALNGLPYIEKIRSSSSFGFSIITAIFEDSTDVYFARQLVQQRLLQMSSSLPADCPTPQLGPVVSSFSNVYMYCLESDRRNFTELRTIQDWEVARKLRAVPGVANVSTYGGFVKQYHIIVRPQDLHSYGLRLTDLIRAVNDNNENAGGNFIEKAGQEVIIRGIGRIESIDDIKSIVLKTIDGTPVRIWQVADVVIGEGFRRGSATKDGNGEAITAMVMTRKGVNTKEVVARVQERVKEIQSELPPDVKIVPYYDQTELVDKTIETVKEILFFSGGLVIVILTAVLLHIPSALIVAVIIPLSMLFSFILMKFTGLSANLMTLGAVDFGVIVDAGVVMVENIFRNLSHHHQQRTKKEVLETIRFSAQEVGRPIVFAISIIMVVYLPLFTLEGVEGKMFHPLALTFIYALLGSLVVALTVIPVLCYFFMQKPLRERENVVVNWITKVYKPALDRAILNPKKTMLVAVAALVASFCLVPFLGSEFIPSLDEGPILLRTKLHASSAHTETSRICNIVEKLLLKFPEVTTVVGRTGRSGTGPGLEGVESTDLYVGLKPKSEWTTTKSKEKLVDMMAAKLDEIPGLMFSFSQPIADMIDDLIAGIRADLGIKIFGPDIKTLDSIAENILHEVGKVRGAVDMQREQLLGLPQLKIEIDRSKIARLGLDVADVQTIIRAALAGQAVTEVIEGTMRFDVLIRFHEDYRSTPEQIGNIFIIAPTGARIKLSQIANIHMDNGFVTVNRENGQRRTAVLVNVRGRDLGSFVADAQERVAKNVKIPRGYKVVWSGQFENQQRAMAKLSLVVPCVLLLIFLLLFASFRSLRNAGLIMLNVPFAMIGGIVALFLSHETLSVPAIIGFIALFGVAVQNGVILISYIMQLQERGQSLDDAVREGATVRLRPVMMTALVAAVGLIPKIVSPGTGAEVQRPLALVVLGGIISATLLTLLVLPAVYRLINQKTKFGPKTDEPLGQEEEEIIREAKAEQTELEEEAKAEAKQSNSEEETNSGLPAAKN
ncbi:MAG: efflux RND transporter permease subunit [Candidatus Melainabacteria bacterium]|nr:MAG: efflux RND transporter permease subunit [Candidatus Melainabacteria bacterium]